MLRNGCLNLLIQIIDFNADYSKKTTKFTPQKLKKLLGTYKY